MYYHRALKSKNKQAMDTQKVQQLRHLQKAIKGNDKHMLTRILNAMGPAAKERMLRKFSDELQKLASVEDMKNIRKLVGEGKVRIFFFQVEGPARH